jgi:hypothetical protein
MGGMQSVTVVTAMREINRAWLEGRFNDMTPLLHPDIVMVFPGFAGRLQGRESFLDGFRSFRESSIVHGFREMDFQEDVAGSTAVVSYVYEIEYERDGLCYQASGRDLWIFQARENGWTAVWRTMLDWEEKSC